MYCDTLAPSSNKKALILPVKVEYYSKLDDNKKL